MVALEQLTHSEELIDDGRRGRPGVLRWVCSLCLIDSGASGCAGTCGQRAVVVTDRGWSEELRTNDGGCTVHAGPEGIRRGGRGMEALGRGAEARPEPSVHLPRLTVLGDAKPPSRHRPLSRDRLGRGSLAQQTATARDGDREVASAPH